MGTIKLILYTFRDLTIRFLPKGIARLIVKPAEFAFLVHPRDLEDVEKKYPFVKLFSACLVRFCVKHLWPVIVSPITGLRNKEGKEILGYVVSCPMLASQMIENRSLAVKRIIQVVKLAEKTGAKIVGLGALTSSLTKGGLDIKNKININVTSGYVYTPIIVTEHVFKVIDKLDIDPVRVLVAVVGAGGNIGSNSAKILVEKGIRNLLLIDLLHRKDKINKLSNELKLINLDVELKLSSKIHDVCQADIIIAATNAPDAVIRSVDLKPGTIIVDDAQPSDIDKEVFIKRDDLLILEGGVINTPGIESHFNFGLKNEYDNFSCLGEVLILAHSGLIKNYTPEEINKDLVDKIKKDADKLDFRVGDFQNYYKIYSEEDIKRIKSIRKKNYGY